MTALPRALLGLAVLSTAVSAADPTSPESSPPPAEEIRLNSSTFREALKKRGLTDILELYLREHPPGGDTEAVLALRDVKLAEFQDPRRPRAERFAAIAEGNNLLDEAIRAHPQDPRRFEWSYTLAHSLIHHEAEPLYTALLYYGGTQSQRRRLATLTSRALTILADLEPDLSGELERLEKLGPSEYERLERSGYIESLDRLPARVEYLRLWTLLYDALARDPSDRLRAENLTAVRVYFADRPALLSAASDADPARLPALLLAGMAQRLLNDHTAARDLLDRALDVADRLGDAERQSLAWAVTLAHVERIRTACDRGQWDAARTALMRFRASIPPDAPDALGRLLVAALAERSVWMEAARRAENDDRQDEADRLRRQSWQPLAELTARHPQRRDEIYAVLHAALEPDADPRTLDPMDVAATLAGLLAEAAAESAFNDDASRLRLLRAAAVGEDFLARQDAAHNPLTPEILFNLAVAEYRLGRPAPAADRFLRIAREYPDAPWAQDALMHAVDLAALVVRQREEPFGSNRRRYADALELLLARYPDGNSARYWRFYYARLLAESGDCAAAAEHYAKVPADHDRAVEARLDRLMCLLREVQSIPLAEVEDRERVRQFAVRILDECRAFTADLSRRLSAETSDEHRGALRDALRRAAVIAADVHIHPAMAAPTDALALLHDIDDEVRDQPTLVAEMWRIRLLAYRQTGQLDEAARALPRYVQADPQGAPHTLQLLFDSMISEARQAAEASDPEPTAESASRAEAAVLLAEQLRDLHARDPSEPNAPRPPPGDIQLAEALVLARRYDRARDLLQPHFDPAAAPNAPPGEETARARFTLAEAWFGLRDFESALTHYNLLATRLPAQHPLRWRALVRDLQCRTALGQNPADIRKVIAQQRYLHPDLGGPARARELEHIERQNSPRP